MRRLVPLLLLALGAATACGYIPKDLWEKTWRYARGFGLDPYLVAAVVWTESRYCPDAVGKAGEVGLGQFMPGTAMSVGMRPEWRSDPNWALWATAKHLRALWNSFRDWPLALAAYNAGAARVQSGRIPESTRWYVKKVLRTYWKLKGG